MKSKLIKGIQQSFCFSLSYRFICCLSHNAELKTSWVLPFNIIYIHTHTCAQTLSSSHGKKRESRGQWKNIETSVDRRLESYLLLLTLKCCINNYFTINPMSANETDWARAMIMMMMMVGERACAGRQRRIVAHYNRHNYERSETCFESVSSGCFTCFSHFCLWKNSDCVGISSVCSRLKNISK